MRFIGNKEKLLDAIFFELDSRNIKGNSFFDFFSGTSNVGKFFKKKGCKVYSSDLMFFSYVLQKAYIENNIEVCFDNLLPSLEVTNTSSFSKPLDLVVSYLNNIEPLEGFIYQNYAPTGSKSLDMPRMYFSDENARKIDAIRTTIENWKIENLLSDNEYYILIACLIETVPFYANISGVYAAFHKKWDPRAVKKLQLRSIELLLSNKEHKCFNCDSSKLISQVDVDILYLDPPYNHRQYAPNYHLLETIAKYDAPKIMGVSGMREYSEQKSKFCNKLLAIQELDKIAAGAKYKYLVLSYNCEGVMTQEDIECVLNEYGNVELIEFNYRRYKSNNNGLSKTKQYVKEQLYTLERKQ
tara:strand:+ start:70 stop:1134 length:1065 start_codon:yes stop_codon:yes gene_type:complete